MGLRAFVIFSFLLPVGAQAVPTDRVVKERLDYHLFTLQETARSRRLTTSAISMGVGAVFGVVAFVAANSNNATLRSSGPWIFGISGGVLLITGAAGLFVRSAYEKLPERYRLMPEKTEEELKTKRAAGEMYLSSLARDARAHRLLSAAISIGIGATGLIMYATDSTRDSDFFLYQGILLAGLGAANLVIRSPAEQEADAYTDWKSEKGVFTSFRLDLVPLRSGAAVFASARF